VQNRPHPEFDVQCPMLTLPLVLDTGLETIPAEVPYLRPDPVLAQAWKERVAVAGERLKVGIVWAGNPAHKNDRHRSLASDFLAPLAHVPGIWLCNLQMSARAGQAVNAEAQAAKLGMTDWTAELLDFADTAALVANLDLVISVDTSIAHLAGAMGKPVWLLLPLNCDWRWLTVREDSPWYPTMRLFRQKKFGDWTGVIQRVVDRLGEKPAKEKLP
jgi:ADP-heptose:LPS heptosyltransferase